MSLYKRPGSRRWWYKFNLRGRRIQASTFTTNKEAARGIEAAHRVRLAQGFAGIVERAAPPSLRELAPRFLADVELRRPRSLRFYRQQTAAVLAYPALAAARLDEIRPPLIARYTAWRRRQVGVASTNRALATLRRILRVAVEWELLPAAPRVALLAGEKPRDYVLPPAAERRYLALLPEPRRTAAVLMLEAALRPSEALGARWEDVDFSARGGPILRVRREIAKRGKPRAVPLSRRARAALEALPRRGEWVFGDQSQALNRMQKQHRRARQALQLPAGFVLHSLRHTALTRIGAAGADAFTLAALAGHSSVVTTQRYVHPVPATLRAAIDRAAEVATVEGDNRPETPPSKPRANRAKR